MVRKHQTAGAQLRPGESRDSGFDAVASSRNDDGGNAMQYRQLGRSGLKVSPICLGTMMFGGPTDEATAGRIIARAHEQGVNFIDTADVYNDGRAEEVVGRAIARCRDWWVLATKLANPT